MGDLGDRLRQARGKKHLSLEEAAAATKIKVEYLQALEAEQYELLPSSTYARGFLKIYAYLLGLDYEGLLQLYDQASGAPEPQVVFAPPRKTRTIPFFPTVGWTRLLRAAAVMALLVLFGVGLFNLLRGERRMPSSTVGFAVVGDPFTPETMEKLELPDEFARPRSPADPVLKLEARAEEDVWLEVRADGALIFYGLLRAGAPVQWKAEKDYKVRVGNTEKVHLVLNGEEIQFPEKASSDIHFSVDREGVSFED